MSSTCCRLCLSNSDDLESIFSVKNGSLLLDLIRIICPIPIETAEDDLPQSVCQECVEIVTSAHQIRVLSVQSDFKLRSMRYRDPLVKSEVVNECSVFVESPQKFAENREEQFEEDDRDNNDSMQQSDDEVDISQNNTRKDASGCIRCNHCDRTFINSSNVRRHERRAHNIKNITKPHLKCEKCSYQTYQQTNMTFHMQKHSTGAKKCDEIKSPLECGYCQKGFLTPSNRVRHEKTVHGSSERLYPCNLCFKSFITEVKLIKHVENHHATATDVVESDDKPESSSNAKLLCDHCPYQTNCRITLTRHMVSHLKGTKPQTGNISRLQCRFCTKAFNHLSNRKRHEVEKHLLKTSRSKISASLRNSSTKSSAKSGIIKKKNENIN